MEVKIDDEGARMGTDAQLVILVKNLSSHPRRTTLHSQVAVMYYTGVVKSTIKKEQISVELQPNEGDCSLERRPSVPLQAALSCVEEQISSEPFEFYYC